MTRQEHLLIILAEECAEVQQAITKALRFGLNEGRDIKATNVERLSDELNDVLAVVEMLSEDKVGLYIDLNKKKAKKIKVELYLKYSAKCGTLKEAEEC